MDSARIAGSLTGAGLIALLGMAHAYIFITLFYAMSFCLTFGVYRSPRSDMPRAFTPLRDLGEGFRYVWNTPAAVSAMALAVLVNLTAFPMSQGLLPYVAREIYRIDQQGLGFLIASFACGSLAGSIALSLGGRSWGMARLMIGSMLGWYALLMIFPLLPSAKAGMVVLMIAGFAQSLAMVPMSVILLRTAEDRLRGRVMGVRMLAVYSLPIGLLGAGVLIQHLGYVPTVALYCSFGIAAALLIALRWRSQLWEEEPGPAR
jgi:predicted MFS family arabinose efflux permease